MKKTNPIAAFFATLLVITGTAAACPAIQVNIEIRLVQPGK
jgi:hypothetical protein